jgi:glycosyltransferase involved in cell wall biosynthesis
LTVAVGEMMENRPRVSVVVSFLNAERFFAEAIESVFAQTFKSWELLLVDDGSSDSSTVIARHYSTEHPHLVRYLDHPHHRNRGLPASRNLGIGSALGDYIAFLDSDDVWLPNKLEQQVAIMDSHSRVSLVFGASLYWRSWADNSGGQRPDYVVGPGIPANRVYEPPVLLKMLLSDVACVASFSNCIFRREVIANLGGFDEGFSAVSGMYEDQAFLAKVYLSLPVFVSDECWDRLRLHADSLCARVHRTGQYPAAMIFYRNWIVKYLSSQGAMDAEIKDIMRRRLWPYDHPILFRLQRWGAEAVKKLKHVRAGLHHGRESE